MNREKGITVLISSHYLDELSKIATNYGFINKGKVIKEISSKELKQSSKKRLEILVSNVKECVKYLEEHKISYEVISEKQVNVYSNVNISELVIALSNKNCIVKNFREKEETLENYYMNLIGGEKNV